MSVKTYQSAKNSGILRTTAEYADFYIDIFPKILYN